MLLTQEYFKEYNLAAINMQINRDIFTYKNIKLKKKMFSDDR